MKNCLKVAGLAVAGAMVAGSALADPISGTFVGANTSNTQAQGGGTWASNSNAAGHWFDRSGNVGSFDDLYAISGVADSGGYSGFNAGDADIVTTLTGLVAGQQYDVNFIWSGVWGNSDFPMSVGFDPGSVTQVPDGQGFNSWVDETSNNGGFRIWEDAIGTATADASGEIDVYINFGNVSGNYFVNSAYNGLSYTAVPEPGSLALLGLGGLGLLRRRR